ncbi:MAG: HAD family hydrolase [Jiangellaceae bacterium]
MGALSVGRAQAVLLDLDGTLIDSEPMHGAAYQAFFDARGWDVSAETRRHFMGRRGGDVFASLPGPWRDEDPDALVADVLSYLDHDATPPAALPGAVDCVRSTQARGIPIALVTSANRAWAEFAVGDVLGLRQCFSALITWEDVVAGKPDPAPYAAGAAALHVDPARALAVEDTVPGVQSALAAGVGRVVAVTTTTDAQLLHATGAHRVVDSLADLLDHGAA